jgi:hypothetical protein
VTLGKPVRRWLDARPPATGRDQERLRFKGRRLRGDDEIPGGDGFFAWELVQQRLIMLSLDDMGAEP